MNKKILTLCLIHQPPRILLGLKKRGFGVGRWNGFGGKVQQGETIEQAARREVLEEAGITIGEMERAGVIDFEFASKVGEILEVHIFRSKNFSGEPQESDEMKPAWYHVDEIPFREMWPDDIHWMPLFLAGKKFTGKFLFGEGDKVLNYELKEISDV